MTTKIDLFNIEVISDSEKGKFIQFSQFGDIIVDKFLQKYISDEEHDLFIKKMKEIRDIFNKI